MLAGCVFPGLVCDVQPALSTHLDVESMGSPWGEGLGGLGPGKSWGRETAPLVAFPPGVQILSTATSLRHLVERTRGRRCPGNAGMPSNKSKARVTCLEWTN